MLNCHPQTLRMYEREGLIRPARAENNVRMYSEEDIDRLRDIQTLTQDMGVNLAGVDLVLRMRRQIADAQRRQRKQVRRLREEVQAHFRASIEELRLEVQRLKETITILQSQSQEAMVRVNRPLPSGTQESPRAAQGQREIEQ